MMVRVTMTSLPDIVVVWVTVSHGVEVGGVGTTIGEEGTSGTPALGLGVVLVDGLDSWLMVVVIVMV